MKGIGRNKRLAAAVERDSEHTIAQGIGRSAEEKQLSVPKGDQVETRSRVRASAQ